MKEPDLALRAHSLPNLPSTPPAEQPERISLDQGIAYPALAVAILSKFLPTLEHAITLNLGPKDERIYALDNQIKDQLAVSASQNDVLEILKQEVEKKEKELEQIRECHKELRTEFGKLKKEDNLKEAEICKCNETIQRLAREKLELHDSAGQPFAKTIEILESDLRLVRTRRDCLQSEVELLRKGKAERDIVIEKEKKLWVGEMEGLVKERNEAKEEKERLLSKVQGFNVVKQELEELVAKRERTIDDKLLGIDRLESDIRRIKDERENYRTRAHRMEDVNDDLEGELNGLKRKLDNINVALLAPVDVEAPPTKRPRTPQSEKRDGIPACPRAMADGSLDLQRGAPMCSPTDGRHARFPGNEVRKRESSQQRPYPRRR
ncbi:hypothetical protein N431DRAFT_507016 [Stipitochalara longipes BDJ]|nr:hypothetical protein N431DRAFT_507016 [Stipitochalara longipes BDJ]